MVRWLIVNDELERIWEDTVVVRFEVQSLHVPENTEDNQGETFNQVNPSLDQGLKARPPEYEGRIITIHSRYPRAL
jgi:hypothetical protein